MNNKFQLDQGLQDDGQIVTDLKLCQVILVNNRNFPWIILVPKIADAIEITDLSKEDAALLMEEIYLVSDIVKSLFDADKLNIASLGNIVSQLHVHIIARYEEDIAWPEPVFGKDKQDYEQDEYKLLTEALKKKLHE